MEIIYADSTQNYLLFIFSTTCPFCEKNIENWKKIARENKNDRSIILGISIHNLEDTKKYYISHQLNFKVALADTSFARKYKIYGVPETILISGKGAVKEVYPGVLTNNQIQNIKDFMGTQMPIN
ncbi:MAG: TlpA family protein disulfide reductase [Ignavibacteriales bacterium]|nr:TlpA family protein disulfide reductase [Ignavibacteriales bacterium]